MKRVYIDFDSTLFDTQKFRQESNEIIGQEICSLNKTISKADLVEEISLGFKEERYKSYYQLCTILENKHSLEHGYLKKKLEEIILDAQRFLYSDSVGFLKNLKLKGYEINILTYTSKNSFDYQMKKIYGSQITSFIDNLIICTKNKGELGLDYEHGIFIDDNPDVLYSLFKAGVNAERIIRMKRKDAGYSQLIVDIKNLVEVTGFDEINL